MTKAELEERLRKRRDDSRHTAVLKSSAIPFAPDYDPGSVAFGFNVGHDSLSPLLIEAVEVIEWYADMGAPQSQYIKAGLHLKARAFLSKLEKELG